MGQGVTMGLGCDFDAWGACSGVGPPSGGIGAGNQNNGMGEGHRPKYAPAGPEGAPAREARRARPGSRGGGTLGEAP